LKLRIGTCSWKYPSWEKIVYSKQAGINYLEEYAKKYNSVEIDQWFWSLHGGDKISMPETRTVSEYVSSVPDDFRFTVKVPNSITLTHYYRKNKGEELKPNPYFLSRELFGTFLDRLAPMHGRLGPLMFQFEYLNREKMPSQQVFLEQLGEFIADCPEGFNYGIEIRNPNYLNTKYFTFLRELDLRHVFLQGYYMPSIFDLYRRFAPEFIGQTVIRLHGPDRKGIEKQSGKIWDRVLAPKDHELEELAVMLDDLENREIETWLNVNNHYEGSAPLTIDRILRLLKDR